MIFYLAVGLVIGFVLGWVYCALMSRSSAPDGSDSEAFARGVDRGILIGRREADNRVKG